MEWMQDQFHMESSLSDPNYKENFQGLVEVVKNRECDFLLSRDYNYMFQTKNDKLCGYIRLVCIPVDNNSYSIRISHVIIAM